MTKMKNKLDDWKAFVNTMGIIEPIWNKFLLIHLLSTNEMTKVDCNAFLSESESRNLSFLYHSGGDSTLLSDDSTINYRYSANSLRKVDTVTGCFSEYSVQ